MSTERTERVAIEIEGRHLSLSNLHKVLYPATGFSKGDLIAYYVSVGPALLGHLARRPVTFVRYPDGVEGESFFEKNLPRHAPDWIHALRVPRNGRSTRNGGSIAYPLIEDLPSLVWAANLATIELHVPMWRSGTERFQGHDSAATVEAGSDAAAAEAPEPEPDTLVLDLDPGAPASVIECCRVALDALHHLDALGLSAFPKTSGRKGLQLYAPLRPPRPWLEVRDLALELARALEADGAGLVVSNMRRDRREGRILVDWSQNHPAKTTVAPYSLRAGERPSASTPLGWEEVEACAAKADASLLRFSPDDVVVRLETRGDLFAPLLAGAGDGG